MDILCGVEQVNRHPLKPYSDLVCDFLNEYSLALRHDAEAKSYPDVLTFAFWARKGSISKKKELYSGQHGDEVRVGRGIIFHIAPANVPVNCMFTYAFGLLAGNSNIIRVPSKDFPQVSCMLRVLKGVLEKEAFHVIREMTSFVRYDRKEIQYTKGYSDVCNVRVIWGGDSTISAIREFELPPRSYEITFADRYSFGIIDAESLLRISDTELERLTTGFYNDSYLMDQNACSTPHLICLIRGNLSDTQVRTAADRFWKGVAVSADRYTLDDIKASDKYTDLCESIMSDTIISDVKRYDNYLYVCEMSGIPDNVINKCRGRFGMFYEYVCSGLDDIDFYTDTKVQTCAVFGIDEAVVRKFIVDKGIMGIDRVVPFGKTLDIDTIWDGYDLISSMSRVIG